ncbi:kinase-like protein [Parathielavia appendiculata]|uniref:non-specific serine/threonine protein kinase n=1 Tax=Parathielavia appendiculata TaxID=2587402 RepID=A0AAN6U7B5_9PEZI|nr:kinase-like protein [Parathielavia appendiculata]
MDPGLYIVLAPPTGRLLDGCEDVENYEPGGFHPVHLGDVYDGRYRVVHKLGFGGFPTVWLARDVLDGRWMTLRWLSPGSQPRTSRAAAATHPSIAEPPLFAVPEGRFCVDGAELWASLPGDAGFGSECVHAFQGFSSGVTPGFAREVSLQAARALAHLHANGLCHGDLTSANIAIRLNEALRTSPPTPHGPEHIVAPLDFCSAPTALHSRNICITEVDQSFQTAHPPATKQLGITTKYLAPEVCVRHAPSKAPDIWALGCAIFRIRSGDDLFFDYDTNCPANALRQTVMTMGEGKLPQEWRKTRFNEDWFRVPIGKEEGDSGRLTAAEREGVVNPG